MEKKKGLFVAFEGGEGCGKSTQIERLWQRLKDEGHDIAELTREPGCPHLEVNKGLHRMLLEHDFDRGMSDLAAVGLFLADRANHIEHYVRPHLEDGKTVLSSRSGGSNVVFQGIARGVMEVEKIKELNHIFSRGIQPDLTLYLDVPVEESMQRMDRRSGQKKTRFDKADAEFHEKVRSGFHGMCETESGWEMIDGTGDIDEIHERVWGKFQESLSS